MISTSLEIITCLSLEHSNFIIFTFLDRIKSLSDDHGEKSRVGPRSNFHFRRITLPYLGLSFLFTSIGNPRRISAREEEEDECSAREIEPKEKREKRGEISGGGRETTTQGYFRDSVAKEIRRARDGSPRGRARLFSFYESASGRTEKKEREYCSLTIFRIVNVLLPSRCR